MALDRWIALAVLALSCAYGYAAFFTMDGMLPPFMRTNPVLPSTFPKVLAVLGVVCSLVVLFGLEKPVDDDKREAPEIDWRRLHRYELVPALALVGLMIAYALALRPLGFLTATAGFLILGAIILGERRFHVLVPVALIATGTVWYLVQQVLGIFLSPLPAFL